MGLSYQSLDGAWQFRERGGDGWLAGSVPGGVHTDLLALGLIEDPFAGDAELRVQWVAERDWEYRRSFRIEPAQLAAGRLFLVCEGLDTLAEVWLNGALLGATDNMFNAYRWEIGALAREGDNELLVSFASSARYAAERQRQRPFPEVNDPLPGAPYLRKAPSHFGWDWGPRLPPTGIWRSIGLEHCGAARLDGIRVAQRHDDGAVTVSAAAELERWDDAPLRVVATLTAPDGSITRAETPAGAPDAPLALHVAAPLLWWPNGYGSQPLYDLELELLSGDEPLDRRSWRIGLRTVELRQEDDDWGRSFQFVVNGLPVFAKGANWIPADSFPTRIGGERLEQLLGSAAAAHHTMIRVWGGGYYEDPRFYELCDRLGLLVWQDFMFACAVYPLSDEAMLATLREEVRQAVRGLRHHASLALWCGNNEMETGWVDWGWGARPELADMQAAYDRFFHQLLPAWVAEDDADRAYWPSSPSSDEPFVAPNGGARGDIHQWTVWHALKPFAEYRTTPARFASEFGFQSLPCLPTIAAFAEPADWNMTSYVMEHHQRNAGGNGRIVAYLTDLFRLPKDFPSLVYVSQLLQAEAMRIGVEHWRRDPACAGALYWQLNDCWPGPSWSGIDYYGRWKAMHYASLRFFAPLLLSIEDTPERMRLFVTNERREPWRGEVRWSLETLRGKRLAGGGEELAVAALATAAAGGLELAGLLSPEQRRSCVFVAELRQGDEPIQLATAYLAPPKHLALEDPLLEAEAAVTAGRLEILLRGQSLARFVELALDGADAIWSANHFDLPAGRELTVSVELPAGWDEARALAAVRVRSLIDSY
ncbi:MAG TPA: glycoside hydrolase family 2 protein [Herpetosiphonaceae bacterium]